MPERMTSNSPLTRDAHNSSSSLVAGLKQSASFNSLLYGYGENRPYKKTAQKPQKSPKTLSPSAALRNAGVRSDTENESKGDDPLPRVAGTWCLCGATQAELEDAPEEHLTRCSNRECPSTNGLFHLRCADLPDHPPRYVFWFCPTCQARLARSEEPAVRARIDLQSTLLDDWVREEVRLQCDEHEEDVRWFKARFARPLTREEEEANAVPSIESDEVEDALVKREYEQSESCAEDGAGSWYES